MSMQDHKGDQESHGGMSHGMGMMLLGCAVPMAAIVLLPRVGVAPIAALAIGIGGMILLHAGMPLVQRLKNRTIKDTSETLPAEHHHQY